MELKKNPSRDVHKKRPLYFFAALCISCGIVIGAFEMKFKKEATGCALPEPWDDVIVLIDPQITVDRPKRQIRRAQPTVAVTRSIVPTTIAIVDDASSEPESDIHPDLLEPPGALITGSVPEEFSDEPLVLAEEMPKPVDGFEKFYKQLARDLRYPRRAALAEVEGKVFVEFVVDRDGNPTFIKVVRGIGYGCDEEAVKALSKTRWKPGRQRGFPVRVRMVMPIQFSLSL